MLGLVVLFVIGVYLVVSALVVLLAARWAKKRGRRGWVWGGVAAFAMYNLVFWDLIPTLAMHKYYCATEAGFWVYKTPEQWVKENPGGLGTLSQRADPSPENLNRVPIPQNTERTGLTQRFFEDVTREEVFLSMSRAEEKFFDAETGVIIARSIEFILGSDSASFVSGGTLEGWRQALIFGWLPTRQCSVSGKPAIDGVSPFYREYSQLVLKYLKSGEGK
jgi:hypothetical protein